MADYLSTAPYKGTRDFYPAEMRVRDIVFSKISRAVESYGFEKIDAPMVEPVEIYLAKTSEEIVNQQIYLFTDRGDRRVVIRPEMTPTVARMVAGKIRELPRPVRWYSIPNLWRYEKPGKGRLREHWQINADIFGSADETLADVEILKLVISIFSSFGANEENYQIDLNHREILNTVFEKVLKIPREKWAEISRVMDKKEKVTLEDFEKMLKEAGLNEDQISSLGLYMDSGLEFLNRDELKNEPSVLHLGNILEIMNSLGYGNIVTYKPSVVRGFDYYTGIVFEVFDNHPDNRRSLAGGGRYDNLVSAFSKDSINAVGFGMGDVTFFDFLNNHGFLPEGGRSADVYLAVFSDLKTFGNIFKLSEILRESGLRVEISSGHKKLGKQFDEAHNKKIPFVVLQGEEELEKKSVIVKDMSTGSQEEILVDKLVQTLKDRIKTVI